mgnify:CR=1 FL=1
MRFKCIVGYDGTNYCGFQVQKNGNTIEAEIEKALKKITNEDITIYASGRTDSGVHAIGQVFHFDSDLNISAKSFKRAMNSFLPSDIHIVDVIEASDSFHARFSAKKKEYHYLINLGEYNPIKRGYVYQYPYSKIDRKLLVDASKLFIGEIDFRSFTKNQELEDTIRTIYSIDFIWNNDEVTIKIVGSGFMHNMVRIMVAMWLEVARGKYTLEELKDILDKKDRTLAPKTAPSCGLYLYKVYY